MLIRVIYIYSIYSLPPFAYPSIGKIKNTNTIEDFKALDKAALFKEITEQVNSNKFELIL